MKPASTSTLLVFDLFCGLGGWSEAFMAEGGYPGRLVLADVRQLRGSELVKEFGAPTCIVASPPCQEFSYMAMPWSKAKEKQRKIEADPKERERLCELFNHCFRLQREISEACGHYVPMVIENVRGAQKWVGKARWNFGSFYLWGDVPALMPIPAKTGQNFPTIISALRPDETRAGLHADCGQAGEADFPAWRAKHYDKTEKMFLSDAAKQPGIGGKRANGKGDAWFQDGAARHGSKSSARKEASAMIAKIPPPLAQWIARVMKNQARRKAIRGQN